MFHRIRKSMEDRDGGFTLIELLVVVIIIGILAAIAIPVFLNQRKGAVQSTIDSDLRNNAIAIEQFYTTTGAYPASASQNAQVVTYTDGAAQNAKTADAKVSDAGSTFTYNPPAAAGGLDWCIEIANTSATNATTIVSSTVSTPTAGTC